MLDSIAAYIDRQSLLPPGGKVIVAVSGGADSLCLLHLLHQLCGTGKRYPNVQLHAAHLNHQLRGDASAQDAAAVASIVESWGLPLTIGKIDVPALAKAEHRSLEDAARSARYRFLREISQGQPIAVAHHADDQVETLLLHWLRGSGLPGMVGMLPRQHDIIRPLLEVSHVQTIAYCQEQGIIPVEDLSNTDPAFLRNRIRHQLLPLIEFLNPGFRDTLLRNAGVLHTDLDYIETQVDASWPQVVTREQNDFITLNIQALTELPLALQRHLLRRVTSRLCHGQSPLEIRHYTLIEDLLHHPADRQERTLHFPQNLRVTRILYNLTFARLSTSVGTRYIASSNLSSSGLADPSVGARFIAPSIASFPENHTMQEGAINRAPTSESSLPEEDTLPIPGEVSVPGTPWIARAESITGALMEEVKTALRRVDWPEVWRLLPNSRYVVYVDAESLGTRLQVRARRPGDRIQPLGMRHEKKVQDILVDYHIARPERESIPLFFSASHCIWLAGVCLDERVRLTKETKYVARLSIIPVVL